MDVEIYDVPFEGVEKTLIEWVKEAMELRYGEAEDPDGPLALPDVGSDPDSVLRVLQRTRVRMDRVEELQAKARQAKGRIHRMRMQADFEAQVAKDTAMQQQGARRVKEFVTAAEKNADALLASLEEHRAAFKISRAESVADEAYDVIKSCYWGLQHVRSELLEMNRVNMSLLHMETLT